MGSRTGGIALRFQAEARDFCPFQIVQTDSKTHPASPTIRRGGRFADGGAAGRDDDHSPPPNTEAEND